MRSASMVLVGLAIVAILLCVLLPSASNLGFASLAAGILALMASHAMRSDEKAPGYVLMYSFAFMALAIERSWRNDASVNWNGAYMLLGYLGLAATAWLKRRRPTPQYVS